MHIALSLHITIISELSLCIDVWYFFIFLFTGIHCERNTSEKQEITEQ